MRKLKLNLKLAGIVFIISTLIRNGYLYSQEDTITKQGLPEQGTASDSQSPEVPQYVPGELIVKLKEGKTLEDIKELNSQYNIIAVENIFKKTLPPQQTLNELKDKLADIDSQSQHQNWYWQLDKNSREYKEYTAKIEKEKQELQNQIQAQEELAIRLEQRQKRAPEGVETPKLENTYILNADQNINIQKMAKEYSANPNVEYAEPNYIVNVQMIPNDPYYSSQGSWGQDYDDLWGLKKIQADKAWDITQGENIIVAVVDTGIDYNHKDIAANIWLNTEEIPNNGIDDDRNGYIDDVRGYDFANKDTDPMDGYGHGTHCAGTIAAVGNNNIGVIGVAPKAKIMTIKGIDDQGSGNDSNLANCLKYAADKGADVINNSWGNQGDSQLITDAVNYAYSKGCVVIAAAGNDNRDVGSLSPANITNVIAVASSDHTDKKSDFSNFGVKIDVTAPGGDSYTYTDTNKKYQNILSLRSANTTTYEDNINIINEKYSRKRGTSMACPHVSGVAALILAKTPVFNTEQVRYVLRNSADDVEDSGWDINSGYGRINAYQALQMTTASNAIANITSPVSDSKIKGTINIEGKATGISYQVEYAQAIEPYVYTLIDSGSKVDNGVLASWDTTFIMEDGKYILKLTVTDASNLVVETRITVILDNKNLFISSPLNNDVLRAGDKIAISGNAAGYGFQYYTIEYTQDESNWSVIEQSNLPVNNSILAMWDTSFITTTGTYYIKLTGYYSGGKKFETAVGELYFDPTLHPGWPQRIYTEDIFSSEPVIADLNRDGKKEIIAAHSYPTEIVIFEEDGTLVRTISLPTVKVGCQTPPTIGDIDNDGLDEIIVAGDDENLHKCCVFVYKYDGNLVNGWPVVLEGGYLYSSVVLSDLNKDGKLELILVTQGNLYVIGNKGNVLLHLVTENTTVFIPRSPAPVVGDFDSDQELEIAVIFQSHVNIDGTWIEKKYIHIYNLDGSELNGWPKQLPDETYITGSPVVGDIDNDGNIDIVVPFNFLPGSQSGGIYIFDKQGNNLPGWPIMINRSFSTSAALADFNKDGRLEIVIGEENYSKVYVIDYTGQIIDGWPQYNSFILSTVVIIGDFDEDTQKDIIYSAKGNIYARKFDGNLITGFPKHIDAGYGSAGISDIDNDGKLELIGTSLDYDKINKKSKNRASVYVWDIDVKYQPQYDAWPTFQHDNQRTGNCGYRGYMISAPANLTAQALSFSETELTWTDNSDDEIGFGIVRGTTSTGPWEYIGAVNANTTRYTDSSLIPDTTYYYRVYAYNTCPSGYSNVASAKTMVFSTPTDLNAQALSSSQIKLTWKDNSGNETGFRIERGTSLTGPWTKVMEVGTNVTTTTDSSLIPNKTYYYRVYAYHSSGSSGYSNTASAKTMVFSAPTDLDAQALSSSQIKLTWKDNSDDETGFKIMRGMSSTGPWGYVETVGADITTYTNSKLAPNTTYYYHVNAYHSSGSSGYSNTASAKTLVLLEPTDLNAQALSSSQIKLTWKDNSGNETGFRIERGTSLTGPWTKVMEVGTNVTTTTDSSLIPNTIYYYRVYVYNSSGSSGYSNTASAKTMVFSAPTDLDAQALSSSQIKLTWKDNSDDETGFRIERGTSLTGPWGYVETVGADITTYTNSKLAPNTTYYYHVNAYHSSGSSGYSNTASAKTLVLLEPTDLNAQALSSSQIKLTWKDNSGNETGFRIERGTSLTGPWTLIKIVVANVTTTTDSSLIPNTIYYYRVYAYNRAYAYHSSGSSGYSNVASAKTMVFSAPTDLNAQALSSSQIKLTWKDNSDDETGFRIERGTSLTGPWGYIWTVGININTYISTVLPDTTYYYRVYAYNSSDSSYSNVTNAKTMVLSAPTDLTAQSLSSSQIKLTWKDNSTDEKWFIIERSINAIGPWMYIRTVSANITTYTDSSLILNTTYYYRVYAYSTGSSGYSNVVNAKTK